MNEIPLILSNPVYISREECGYCKGKKEDHYALASMAEMESESDSESNVESDGGSSIIGSSVQSMTCRHYDELINQGFRRSGTFLYKPDLLKGCCRLFTIRSSMEHLKLSKQQRKTINKFVKEIGEVPGDNHWSKLMYAQQKSTRFRTEFEPSTFSEEKFELYKKYQVHVHNDDPDDVSEDGFFNFLCKSPFTKSEKMGTRPQWERLNSWTKNWKPDYIDQSTPENARIGPTHECYYLDDKLIAISILDFLPTGVSSIYFIWDPDYAHLSLGTLSGLREIYMCHVLGLGYYYLGYYIDDCVKMRYKKAFGGELLDICNEVFVPIETLAPYLKDGRLFVIDNATNDLGIEPEMENSGYPISLKDSQFADTELKNAAETIYGNKETYANARKARLVLKNYYHIGANEHSLPDVVPGLTPLWQILEWFDKKVLDDQLEVSMWYHGELLETTFGKLSDIQRLTAIDCIRSFGLEKTQDSIIIINY